MAVNKQFKCVNCGEASGALYRRYGASVLKLTKCEKCKGIVDKYVEYDPVIVMIDLVLISREAQRHVIYNTEFKSYWKLFIILSMLETYGVWRNDSLFTIAIDSVCGIQHNSTFNLSFPINISVPESWKPQCELWMQEERDDNDLFIWEKDFYIQFISTFAGIVVFILTVQILMQLMKSFSMQNEVSLCRVLKAFSLAYASVLLTLPMLVWGTADTPPQTRTVHYALVFAYSFVAFYNVFTVLYESPMLATVLVLASSNCAKYLTAFHAAPFIRTVLS